METLAELMQRLLEIQSGGSESDYRLNVFSRLAFPRPPCGDIRNVYHFVLRSATGEFVERISLSPRRAANPRSAGVGDEGFLLAKRLEV